RVCIFSSGEMLSDFSVDPQKIRATLARLQANVRSITRVHDCPDLSDYQALEITQQNPEYSESWQMALDEAVTRCKLMAESDASSQGDSPAAATSESAVNPKADSQLVNMIRMRARNIVFQVE